MITDEEFRQGLAAFIRRVSPAGSTLLAKVQSVDEGEGVCVLVDDSNGSEVVYPDVRLRPVVDGSEGITMYPNNDTWAVAVRIEDSEDWLLLAAGTMYKYRIKVGATTIELTNDGLVMNGGAFGGLVKLDALVSKLNAVERDLNTLKNIFNSWQIVLNDGGGALKALATAAWSTQTITATKKEDLENPKVKQ